VSDDDVPALLFKTSRVGHQVAKGNRLTEGWANLEVEVAVDVSIEIQLSLLLQLHDGDPGKELRDRRQSEDCRHRIDRCLLLPVSVAIAFLQKYAAVLHYKNRRAGDIRAFHLQRDDPVEEGLKVSSFERMCSRRNNRSCFLFWMRLRRGRSNRK